MKSSFLIFTLVTVAVLFSCKKDDDQKTTKLPDGATPYTESDIQFVPYSFNDAVFKKMPLLDSTLTLNFIQRLRSEEYFAWDQTFFSLSNDAALEIEFRLRYLQTDKSQKTLAVYVPYRDANDVARHNIFEMPISPNNIENGFFKNLIDYHDTIVLNDIYWYKVYEINPLISTDSIKDGPENYSKIFYNATYGLIQMSQKNGTVWMLQQ